MCIIHSFLPPSSFLPSFPSFLPSSPSFLLSSFSSFLSSFLPFLNSFLPCLAPQCITLTLFFFYHCTLHPLPFQRHTEMSTHTHHIRTDSSSGNEGGNSCQTNGGASGPNSTGSGGGGGGSKRSTEKGPRVRTVLTEQQLQTLRRV